MSAVILVHEKFERTWSWAAEYWREQWLEAFDGDSTCLSGFDERAVKALSGEIPGEYDPFGSIREWI